MKFSDRLIGAIRAKQTPLVVGLDPRIEQLPDSFPQSNDVAAMSQAFQQFCIDIIDVVAPLVPAVKPQAAFFEMLGHHGMHALANVVKYAHDQGMIVVMDAKRGDIGSTAEAYSRAFFRRPY